MGIGSGLGSFAAAMEARDRRRKEQYLNESPKGAYTNLTPAEVANGAAAPERSGGNDAEVVPSSGNNVTDALLAGIKFNRYDIPQAAHGKQKVKRIVGHRTAGTGFHPDDLRLTKKGFGAHYTILPDGSMAVVNSPETKMWHAGPKGNRDSVGIEVVGRYKDQVKDYKGEWDDTGGWEPMTDAQKKTLKTFGERLISYYNIPKENIQPHYRLASKSGTEGQQVVDVLKGWYR